MKPFFYSMIACIGMTIVLSCSGNGSEISTRAGMEMSGNGACVTAAGPADSAIVIAVPKDYVPFDSSSAPPETLSTDSKGIFSFRKDRDLWNLIIYDRTRTFGAFVPHSGDSVIGTVFLDDLGYITGNTGDTSRHVNYVGIVGTPFFTQTLQADSFFLPAIPTATYFVKAWETKDKIAAGTPPYSAADSVFISPGQGAVITIFH
jgi:hypothetical protein